MMKTLEEARGFYFVRGRRDLKLTVSVHLSQPLPKVFKSLSANKNDPTKVESLFVLRGRRDLNPQPPA